MYVYLHPGLPSGCVCIYIQKNKSGNYNVIRLLQCDCWGVVILYLLILLICISFLMCGCIHIQKHNVTGEYKASSNAISLSFQK